MKPNTSERAQTFWEITKRLLTQTDVGELFNSTEEEEENQAEDGGSNPEPSDTDRGRPSRIPPSRKEGKWRERWQDSMDDQTGKNMQMIYENRELLERLDERSTWTMRLLVGIFVTIISSVFIQLVIV